MGGATFITTAKGTTAQEAFISARRAAQDEDGHGGYSGTIAEKYEFKMATRDVLTREKAVALAEKHLGTDGGPFDDKWGPAGCIKLDDGRFLFFGWASC